MITVVFFTEFCTVDDLIKVALFSSMIDLRSKSIGSPQYTSCTTVGSPKLGGWHRHDMSVASTLSSLSLSPCLSIYLLFHSPSRFCTPVGSIVLHDPKLLRRPLLLSVSLYLASVCHMKRDAAGQSLLYRVASLAFTSPLSVQCRSLRLFAREFLAVAVRFSSEHNVCYCPAVPCPPRDRHCMTMLLEEGLEESFT
jgi:hypothetical protein